MSEGSFRIGLIQLPVGNNKDTAVAEHERKLREAADRGAQVVCLQELFHVPYFCKANNTDRFDLAEPIPGSTIERIQGLAQELGIAIVVPLFERRAAGVYHNSAAVVDADGSLLGVYRKMHIPDDPLYYEKYYFTPGEASQHQVDTAVTGFRAFDTQFGRIGVLICWDQWYPEGARITALMGAQVLFYPTTIGWHPHEKEEWGAAQVDAWRTVQRGHAIANGVYVAAVNRVGFEAEEGTGGIEFFGHSFVCDPFGQVIEEAGTDPTVLIAEVEPARIESTRRNWPFLRDRRVDAYGPILDRWLA